MHNSLLYAIAAKKKIKIPNIDLKYKLLVVNFISQKEKIEFFEE